MSAGFNRSLLYFAGFADGQIQTVFGLFFFHLVFVADFADQAVIRTQTQYFVVRCFHVRIRQNHDFTAVTGFDTGDQGAFFVQQEGSNGYRHNGADLSGVLFSSFFFDQAQN